MSEIMLQGVLRTPGKKEARSLRDSDNVPGVYYAKNQEPIHFSVDRLALRKVVHTDKARIVNLEINGSAKQAVLKDVTFDPISDKILHFDLLGVKPGDKLKTKLAVHLSGLAAGVRAGGRLEHVMQKARVMVDPTRMPEHIEVDITNLNASEAIRVSNIQIDGVQFLDRPTSVIATVHPPKGVAKEEAAPTKKGKK